MNKDWWQKARDMLMVDEGVRLKPYHCPAGKLTIGVGRNIEDNGITHQTAIQMLDEDIQRSVKSAEQIFGREVYQSWSGPRQRAVVNMIFNLGEHGFLKFVETIRAIRAGNWKHAAERAKQSLWAKQVGKRADRVIAMMGMENEPSDS